VIVFHSGKRIAFMKTGVHWLDEIVEQANLPQRVNRDTAALIYGKLIGEPVSKNTLRRLPIPYKLVDRDSSYEVANIVAAARKRLDEAPVRCPLSGRPRPTRPAPKSLESVTP
jgi:hypothetical protein